MAFFGTGHNDLLAGDLCQLIDGGLQRLGVLSGFAEATVNRDLEDLGNFVDVGEREILLQLGLNGLPVALLE
jgi:hypothetical protein